MKWVFLYIASKNVKSYKPYEKQFGSIYQMPWKVCSWNPEILYLGIYSKEITQDLGGDDFVPQIVKHCIIYYWKGKKKPKYTMRQ